MTDAVAESVKEALRLAAQGQMHEGFSLALKAMETAPSVALGHLGCLFLIRRSPDTAMDSMVERWLKASHLGNVDNAALILPELFEAADDLYSVSSSLAVVEFRRGRWASSESLFANCLTASLPEAQPAQSVEEEYAAKSEGYDDNHQHQVSVSDFMAFLERNLGPAPLGRVVDIPCGTGTAAEALRPHASHLVGSDLSARMLDKARDGGHYDQLILGDMVEVLAGLEADTVFSHGSLYYFPDLEPVMAAAARTLRGGGYFAFTDYPAPSGVMATICGNLRYCRSRDVVRGLAERHGFREQDCRLGLTFGLPCLYWLLQKS